MEKIIGISGKMSTGKTTLANHIAALTGGTVISFANGLRQEVLEHFCIPISIQKDAYSKATLPVTVGRRTMLLRELLQWWGALRREGNENYWVDKALKGLGGGLTIIDDVRYKNEAEAVHAAGGLVFRLDPYDGWEPGIGAEHISETDLDDWYGFNWRFAPTLGSLPDHARDLVNTFRLP